MRPDIVAISLAVETLDGYPHPDLAPASAWPGVMLIIIVLGFFATAAVLGPLVRAIMQHDLAPLEEGADESERKRAG
jgi:hypothetical protein